MKRFIIIIGLITLMAFSTNSVIASHSVSFSNQLNTDQVITWQVMEYQIDNVTIEEISDEHFIAQNSIIEITITQDPSTINLTDSLDVSDYFEMVFDDTRVKDLNTLFFFTIGGQIQNQYLTYWESFIYFIFPIIDENGDNRFDNDAELDVGLTYIDMSTNTTAYIDSNIFYFSQEQVGSYEFNVEFDYSTGIMRKASAVTDSGTNVTIHRTSISTVENDALLNFNYLGITLGIFMVAVISRNQLRIIKINSNSP